MKKIALITGGSKGIGKAIVEKFVREGYFVYFTYNNSMDAASKLVLELGDDKVFPFQLAATDDKGAYELINLINKNNGQIDVFISNAGITNDNHFIMMSKNDWNNVIDVNLNSVFTITKIVSKLICK